MEALFKDPVAMQQLVSGFVMVLFFTTFAAVVAARFLFCAVASVSDFIADWMHEKYVEPRLKAKRIEKFERRSIDARSSSGSRLDR